MNIDIKNIDYNINPGDDFYRFSNNGWLKNNPIPNDHVRYGVFDVLNETNVKRINEIIQKDSGKVGMLYHIAMDENKLNKDGIKPIQPLLDEIDKIKNKKELPKLLGALQKFSSIFWSDGVSLDEKNSDFYIFNIGQGGLGLSLDYYFDNDSKKIREEYKNYLKKLSKHFNLDIDTDKIYNLEEKMAKSFNKKELLRNPNLNYHKISINAFYKEYKGFDWQEYFTQRGVKNLTEINVNQPKAIKESIDIINNTDLQLIKDFIKISIISSASSLLDDETYNISFNFYNKFLSGQKKQKPRWKRAVALINGALGEEVGQIYVKKYFPEKAKTKMVNLVENLKKAYAIRIKNLTWLSDKTKKEALLKLDSFNAKIGYPDVWRDYSKLIINNKQSLLENVLNIKIFEDNFWLEKIGQTRDKNIWYMNPHTINAYYDPLNNEICFPAGILQYPFFDLNASDAFNYGGIGSIIGHEMTHGFDDQGRKFDRFGNLKNWWSKEDSKKFEDKVKILIDYFNNINITDNVKANGVFTLGENLADLGGLLIALTAFQEFGEKNIKPSDFTDEQIFFISYSNRSASNITSEQKLKQVKTDEHSLDEWRVNGIVPHVAEWYKAFNIKETDKLYLKPEQRANIW